MRSRVVLAVVLVAISGCGGTFSQTETATVTPVEVPTEEADERLRYPPGVDATGISSVASFAKGHRRAMERQSYVWQSRMCERYVRNGSTVGTECGHDVVVFEDESNYVWNHSDGPNSDVSPRFRRDVTREVYANGTAVFRKFRTDDGALYEREPLTSDSGQFLFTAERIVQLYATVNHSAVQRIQRNDQVYYRIAGTDHRLARYNNGQDYRVTALVAPSGLVYELNASFNQTYGDTTIQTTFTSR